MGLLAFGEVGCGGRSHMYLLFLFNGKIWKGKEEKKNLGEVFERNPFEGNV